MRPQWFEAGPALAAAGLSRLPDPAEPVLGSIWTQPMIDDARYAFLTRIDATTKPTLFPDLHALARHIERRRTEETGDRARLDAEAAGRLLDRGQQDGPATAEAGAQ